MKINSISDFITYLLSLFIPEIKKDWKIMTSLENKLNIDIDNENLFINQNYITLTERY